MSDRQQALGVRVPLRHLCASVVSVRRLHRGIAPTAGDSTSVRALATAFEQATGRPLRVEPRGSVADNARFPDIASTKAADVLLHGELVKTRP